ncbi:MAG: tyrosine-type recombinase/integrase [Marinilabiliaceae bacterium]|nr:tyrosine-type recombinase/integrase [Marinilabiliaceae bacterium]
MITTTYTIPQLITSFLAERDVSEKSKRQYARVLAIYIRYMQSQGIDPKSVTTGDIVAYKAHINKTNQYTSNGYLSIVKVFYKWIQQKGYGIDIASEVKKNKGFYGFTKKYLTESQVRDVCTSIPTHTKKGLRDNAIIRLMLSTGLRTVEIVRANIGDIEQVNDTHILYVQRKARLSKSDFVPLTPHTYDDIAAYLCTRDTATPDEPLFANVRDGSRETRITERCVSGMVKHYLKSAGINDKKISTHSLRHTFACWLIREGVSIYDVMTAMGHSNVKTTEIYSKMIKQELKLTNKTGKTIEHILSRNGIN